MCEQKEPKIPEIVETHTLVNPNAMMIEPLNTDIAEAAVLRPSWFGKFASFTFFILLKHDSIKFISPHTVFMIGLFNNSRFIDTSNIKG